MTPTPTPTRTYTFRTDGTESLASLVERLSEEIGQDVGPLDLAVPAMSVPRSSCSRYQFIARAMRLVADEVERIDPAR